MLALIAAAERFVARNALDFRHPWGWGWRQTGQAARGRAAVESRVLCFGDSLVKFGVLPRVLEARLGRPAYNLALGAGPPPASYFLLRRALEAGARPRAVVVDFIPHLLAHDHRLSARLWPEMLTLSEAADLAWTARDPDFFTAMVLARLLPSTKDRLEIRACLLAAVRGEVHPTRFAVPGQLRNMRVNRGAVVAAKKPEFRGDDVAYAADLYPASWRCHPLNEAYLRRFLELAAARGIRVFWLIPPFSPEVHARRERLGLDARYSRLARAVQASHPNVTVLDARRSGYGPGVHCDPLHLDREGASALSADVAEVLARRLAGPPGGPLWTDLPRYRDRPMTVPLEDIDQSDLAVRTRGRAERR